MNDEGRMKNSEERRRTSTELIIETSWKHYGSASAFIFSFFLLFLTNFKWILDTQGVEPLSSASHALFIAKIGEKLVAQLAQASWLLPDEVSWAHPPNWLVHPYFRFPQIDHGNIMEALWKSLDLDFLHGNNFSH